jgi:hypothetical protein
VKNREHIIQSDFFRWCEMRETAYPVLRWTHAIPNGGHRDIRVAQKLKAEGVKSGIWDVHVPAARMEYAGLYIEFKAGKNGLTDTQRDFRDHLITENYLAVVAYDWLTAAQVTEWYLSGGKCGCPPSPVQDRESAQLMRTGEGQ